MLLRWQTLRRRVNNASFDQFWNQIIKIIRCQYVLGEIDQEIWRTDLSTVCNADIRGLHGTGADSLVATHNTR